MYEDIITYFLLIVILFIMYGQYKLAIRCIADARKKIDLEAFILRVAAVLLFLCIFVLAMIEIMTISQLILK